MKIVFSPSKGQKCTPVSNRVDLKHLIFKRETEGLKTQLKHFTEKEIATCLKVSDKIAKDVWSLYNETYCAYPAYELYTGTAFKPIKKSSVLAYTLDNVYILSALYGVVPLKSEITPYRLDFNSKMHLYAYWKEPMRQFFSPNEKILSLASQEYEKLIPPYCDVTRVRFQTRDKNGNLKSSSVEGKTARGAFLNYLIEKKSLLSEEILLSFEGLGYKYCSEKSQRNELLFIRNQA